MAIEYSLACPCGYEDSVAFGPLISGPIPDWKTPGGWAFDREKKQYLRTVPPQGGMRTDNEMERWLEQGYGMQCPLCQKGSLCVVCISSLD